LKDEEAFTIRTELIQKLADKNQELQAQIEKSNKKYILITKLLAS